MKRIGLSNTRRDAERKKMTTLSDHHPDNYSAIVLDMSLYHLELFIAYIYTHIYICIHIYIFPSEFPLGNGGARAQNQGSFSTFFLLSCMFQRSDFEMLFGRFFGSSLFSLFVHFLEYTSDKNATTFFKWQFSPPPFCRSIFIMLNQIPFSSP